MSEISPYYCYDAPGTGNTNMGNYNVRGSSDNIRTNIPHSIQ
jgi:hypothetical protein